MSVPSSPRRPAIVGLVTSEPIKSQEPAGQQPVQATTRSPGQASRARLVAALAWWCTGAILTGLALSVALSSWAEALASTLADPASQVVANARLNQVISNLRNVLVGLLVALATLFLTVGGVRYLLAGGDPSEAESGKRTLRNAAIGYGIAALAPVLVEILKYIVGA